MSSPKKRRLNGPEQPPVLVNPLRNKTDFFQNVVIPKLEDKLFQNYVKVLKVDPKMKEDSMDNTYEYKVDNKNKDKKTIKRTKLISEHPYLRFFNNATGTFKLVNDEFLKNHRYNLKTKAYVPYKSNMLNVAKVVIARGAFKTVVLVDDTIACSIEVGTKEFIERRKYVLGYLDKVLKTANKNKNGESALRKVLQVPVSSRYNFIFTVRNRELYACTMASNLCRSMDLFGYQMARHKEIKIAIDKNIQLKYFVHFFKDKRQFLSVKSSEADYVLNSLKKLGETLKSLHSFGIALIDIKPENILFCGTNGYDIKLSDLESLVTIEDVPTSMKSVYLTSTARYSKISEDLKNLSDRVVGILSKKDDERYGGVVSALEGLPFLPVFKKKSLLCRINFLLLSFIDFHAMSLVILETMEIYFMLDDFLPFVNTTNPNETKYKSTNDIKSMPQIKEYFDTVISKQSVTEEAGKKYRNLFFLCYFTLLVGKEVSFLLGTEKPNVYKLLFNLSVTVNRWHKFFAPPQINPMLLEEVNNLKIHKPLLF